MRKAVKISPIVAPPNSVTCGKALALLSSSESTREVPMPESEQVSTGGLSNLHTHAHFSTAE